MGGALPETDMAQLNRDLEHELASVRLLPDAAALLDWLRASGLPVVLCSNLAFPYGAPVRRLLADRLALGERAFARRFGMQALLLDRMGRP